MNLSIKDISMKQTLGKLFFSFLLFFTLPLSASPLCDYNLKVSNYTPFVKESVEIVFEAVQKDHSAVMFFDLHVPKSDHFELHLIEKLEDKKSYHDNKTTYTYILYPLKDGEIKVGFDFKVSLASDESIEKFYTGNRDVINPMATKEVKIDINPMTLQVKALEKKVDLVGDFSLSFAIDKKEAQAYEQVNAQYQLSGQGYIPEIEALLHSIDEVELFLERTGDAKRFIKEGKLSYQYALLGEKDFEIPEVKLSCFSPAKKKYYTLSVPSQKITVRQVESTKLLDEKDSYPTKAFVWSDYTPYLNAILLFFAGFLAAKMTSFDFRKKGSQSPDPIIKKIKAAKDEKALLQLLLSTTDPVYKPYIEMLEDSIYGQKRDTLKAVKDALLKR